MGLIRHYAEIQLDKPEYVFCYKFYIILLSVFRQEEVRNVIPSGPQMRIFHAVMIMYIYQNNFTPRDNISSPLDDLMVSSLLHRQVISSAMKLLEL